MSKDSGKDKGSDSDSDEEISPLRKQLREWMDPNGRDYMGSGMTMQEFMGYAFLKKMKSVYPFLRGGSEHDRRVELIIALSVEIQALVDEGGGDFMFISLAKMAVSSIANGDWAEVRGIEEILAFEGESIDIFEAYNPLYAPIRDILYRAYQEAPYDTPKGKTLLRGGKWDDPEED